MLLTLFCETEDSSTSYIFFSSQNSDFHRCLRWAFFLFSSGSIKVRWKRNKRVISG